MTEYIEKNHFSLKAVTPIAEMQGKLWEMEHEKSGAKLVWLERPDENMTFAIGFRTIPTDSTGVFHILEHSVLGGSEKYPVREPFVELLKSSLQTFLNAMTFPDKTVYPVSSRNKQDFRNLVGIYMDAVLHPTAVKNPNIFRQEGWRVEFGEDGSPMFQGVVYNEMKGAFSNVRSVLEHTMMRHLFPDSCYRHESGGDPACIPELTYEQFCAEHAKYYHPSNALIVLDGAVDLDGTLAFLDECLSPYDRQEMVFPIAMQEALPYAEKEIPYEIGAAEDTADKTIVSYGKLLCGFDAPVEMHAANLLSDYLTGGSEGPLKRAILDAGLGADMSVDLHDGMQQEWFGWQVWNTEASKVPEIKRVIRSTVESILEKGLDQERLLGCYNSLAFKLLDRDSYGYPRGLVETLNILEPWLYGGDPAQNLSYRKVLDDLKEKLTSGYMEQLLRRCLLDDSDGFLAVLVPSQTLGQERVAQEQQRVTAYWSSLNEEEKAASRQELEQLHTWQQTPDSPEALATIPMLSLADIQGEPKPLDCTGETVSGVPALKHGVSNDLTYMDLLFEASDATPEDMPVLNLLGSLLGTLATDGHTGSQLQTATRQKIGDLGFSAEVYHKDQQHHRTVFAVRSVCLPGFMEDTAALLCEILNTTKFTENEVVRNILRQKKTGNQQKLISMGNRFAASRVFARESSAGAAKEHLAGFENMRWVCRQCDCTEDELTALMNRMAAMCRTLFVKERLTISLSANAWQMTETFAAAFPSGKAAPEETSFDPLPPCREGIRIPAGVGYAAKGSNWAQFGQKFDGRLYVLSNLLTFEHLWNAVRVQGGAYGTGFRGDSNDDVIATSYRDPSPSKTLEHFDACADVIEQFWQEKADVTRYILGAMSDADPMLGAAGKIHLAEMRYLRKTRQENLARYRRELLGCTIDGLHALCAPLRSMAAKQNYCIIAGQEQLSACGEKLDEIIDIPT